METIIPYMNFAAAMMLFIVALITIWVMLVKHPNIFKSLKAFFAGWPSPVVTSLILATGLTMLLSRNIVVPMCLVFVAAIIVTGQFLSKGVELNKLICLCI